MEYRCLATAAAVVVATVARMDPSHACTAPRVAGSSSGS